MKKSIVLLPFFLLLLLTATAQDSLLIELLKANTHPLQFDKGQLSGAGFDLLMEEGKNSSFFLIGENHGMAENPQFTAALFNAYKQFGYQYFATETGPYTARYLQKTAAADDMYAQMQALLQRLPWSIPFFSWKEECLVLEAVVSDQSADEPVVWGLDQEFAASPRMHFEYLQKNAADENSRAVAKKYFDMAMAALKESEESKNPSKAFMAIVRPDDFEQLKTAFAGQEDNLNLIKELEESIHIYQLWFQGRGYESNYLRAEMMKRHFWDYYSEAKKQTDQPKVMFKFGSNHMYRGANALNVFDIGNFVSELASQEGTQSFHLYNLPRKGTQNTYNPFSTSEADKSSAYDASQPSKRTDYSSLLKATSDTEWSVVDLRPLRKKLFNRSLKDLHPWMEKLIWSYDAVLMIPEVTAATFIE